MQVQGTARDPGPFDDLLDAEAAFSVLQQALDRGLENCVKVGFATRCTLPGSGLLRGHAPILRRVPAGPVDRGNRSHVEIYFIPRMRPSLARRPERDVGIPVARANLRLAAVIPSARFHENVRPGPSFMPSP
jgi:hypothetical protein